MDNTLNDANGLQQASAPMISMSDIDVESLDISHLLSMGYKEAMDMATQFEESGDPDKIEAAKSIREIDPVIFELSPSENQLIELEKNLLGLGVKEDVIKNLMINMVKIGHQMMTEKIILSMNEETKAAWNNLLVHNPNPVQQVYLLDVVANQIIGTTLDDIYEKELTKLISYVEILLKSEQENYKLASKLTPEQATHIKMVFGQGNYEQAIQLIYQFVKENESNS